MRTSASNRSAAAMAIMTAAAACAADDSGIAPKGVYVQSTTVETSIEVSGVVRPRAQDRHALAASLHKHYPEEFRATARRGAVLLDVEIGEDGAVRDVHVLDAPWQGAAGAERSRVMLESTDPRTGKTSQRPYRLQYDPAFGPAASAALHEVRFTPATRGGKPVPYTLRMTVEFAPSQSQDSRVSTLIARKESDTKLLQNAGVDTVRARRTDPA